MRPPKRFVALLAAIRVLAVARSTPALAADGADEYADDAGIAARVKAAILNEPGPIISRLKIAVFKGTVQLSGFVMSGDEKTTVGDLARRVKGVQFVQNDIRLKWRQATPDGARLA
ncbi:MAG: hypothetical protein H6R21_42 [Proteobacteria bacterium]|nr:hypothetical protein [Pseudomonadota bacterium]